MLASVLPMLSSSRSTSMPSDTRQPAPAGDGRDDGEPAVVVARPESSVQNYASPSCRPPGVSAVTRTASLPAGPAEVIESMCSGRLPTSQRYSHASPRRRRRSRHAQRLAWVSDTPVHPAQTGTSTSMTTWASPS